MFAKPVKSSQSMVDGMIRKEFCEICKRTSIPAGMYTYQINTEGGYGMPEMWACNDCMVKAENGSRLAKLRDGIYSDDFKRKP